MAVHAGHVVQASLWGRYPCAMVLANWSSVLAGLSFYGSWRSWKRQLPCSWWLPTRQNITLHSAWLKVRRRGHGCNWQIGNNIALLEGQAPKALEAVRSVNRHTRLSFYGIPCGTGHSSDQAAKRSLLPLSSFFHCRRGPASYSCWLLLFLVAKLELYLLKTTDLIIGYANSSVCKLWVTCRHASLNIQKLKFTNDLLRLSSGRADQRCLRRKRASPLL